MSKRKHTELIDHIRESLQGREEPYLPGAWEGFQQHRERKNRIYAGKVVLSLAASLALVLSVLYVLNDFIEVSPEQRITEQREEAYADNVARPDIRPEPDVSAPAITDSSVAMNVQTAVKKPERADDAGKEVGLKATLPGIGRAALPETPCQTRLALWSPKDLSEPGPAEHPGAMGWTEIQQESHERRVVKTERDKNLSFGLAYTPLINSNDTKTDWGMGGGLYTEWAFTRNLALSSGVIFAQNQLEYDRGTGAEGAGTENLAYIQVDLVSLEIPLNLRYYLTDHISVSAGISSAAFLKEDYNYTYEYQREIQVLTYTESSGFEPVVTKVTITESEKQSEPSFNSMDWAAFYTFSFGYQYDIADKHTLSLEPFVKVPSGQLTTRNIKYYTGGIQLKISF